MSVVTQSEGAPGLQKMAEGLMMRYKSSGQTPPCLLYTDRDCCSQHSETLFSVSMDLFRCEWMSHIIDYTTSFPFVTADTFYKWPTIQVRLDIYEEIGQRLY